MQKEPLLKRILTFKQILILLAAGILLLLIPMLILSFYNVQSADDYIYGSDVRDTVMAGGGLFAILRTALMVTKRVYFEWQGTLSAVFLFSLQPAVFGEQYYAMTAFIMLFSLMLGIFSFIPALWGSICKSDSKTLPLITACIIAIICTQFLPSPAQGFYWYNGSVYYTFFFGISLFLYTAILRLIGGEKRSVVLQAAVTCLCVIIALSNYITALITLLILLTIFLLLIKAKNSRWKRLIIPLVLYTAAFSVSMTAPGNSIRQATFPVRPGILGSVRLSFEYAVRQLYTWNKLPVIALYILAVPVLWEMARKTEYAFKRPWLVTLYSFCLFSAMNFPTYYAVNYAGDGRYENIRFYAMVILIIINLFYFEGWLIKRFEIGEVPQRGYKVSFLLEVCLLFAFGFFFPRTKITSLSAVYTIASGQAGVYKNESDGRLPYLHDPDLHDVRLPAYTYKPYLLFYEDIQTDPDDWRNSFMSMFYHKDSIMLISQEEFDELNFP